MLEVKLETQDRIEIEKLHYLVNATADLLNRLTLQVIEPANIESAMCKYTNMYAKQYEAYEKKKAELEKKYMPTEGNFKTWHIDFDNELIIFEE